MTFYRLVYGDEHIFAVAGQSARPQSVSSITLDDLKKPTTTAASPRRSPRSTSPAT